ncbi:hypothetical protein BDQ17DRAFT_1546587 [Cyathus striatus]|nr:hypothetical protein BDQ17DRAFT_1546587 [Cyathus striatus]
MILSEIATLLRFPNIQFNSTSDLVNSTPASTAMSSCKSLPVFHNVPQEIINLIVDIVSDQQGDLSTFKNLSLVARIFRDQCQRYLFRRLVFTVTPYNKMKCSLFVLKESPHIGQHVDSLEIYGSNSITLMIQGDRSFSEEIYARHKTFRELLILLPNVKSIIARAYMPLPPTEWTYEFLTAMQSYIASRSQITQLCLHNVPRLMLPTETGSVGPFDQPYFIKAEVTPSAFSSSEGLSRAMVSVRCRNPSPKIIYDWICSQVLNPVEKVAELVIELHAGFTEGTWGTILQCSSSLRILTLNSEEYWDADLSAFNLNLLPKLEILIISTTFFLDHNGRPLHWWTSLRQLFSSIDPQISQIEEIRILGAVCFHDGRKIPISNSITVPAYQFDLIPEIVHQFMPFAADASG